MVKKEKKKKSKDVMIDGVNTSEMSREQLEKFALKLREECEREREERNYFQIERDKLRTYWEMTKQQLEEAKAQLQLKDHQIETTNQETDEKIKLFRQKIKHMKYEQTNSLAELRAEEMASIKVTQDNYAALESELMRNNMELKTKIREQEEQMREDIKKLKMEQIDNLSVIREEFKTRAIELEQEYENRQAKMRSELDVKYQMEITELEERKNRHINELIKKHDDKFEELKNYYNDITLNNLALISGLKEQIETMNTQAQQKSKMLSDLMRKNAMLNDKFSDLENERKELKRQLQNYEKDKMALRNKEIKLRNCTRNYENLQCEYDALVLNFECAKAQRNQYYEQLSKGTFQTKWV